MRVRASKDGVTLRVIAGTNSALLALDLADAKRDGCLGFSIERTDMDTGDRRWLPNMLRFTQDPDRRWVTTARAPLQRFRWGDYTIEPGRRYRYRAIARYGSPEEIIAQGKLAERPGGFDQLPGGVSVEVRSEDNRAANTAVFFNRGAAASKAYVDKFGDSDPDKIPAALQWLSRGLEEALLAFLAKAVDSDFTLHAVVYEFQKSELLAGLKQAMERGAQVEVVYHAREKPPVPPKKPGGKPTRDKTREENEAAIKAAGLEQVCHPRAKTPAAIMHNKYVVLLKAGRPVAVWTGSTNWTDGGLYGQLNVGHAVYDLDLAQTYEDGFQLLRNDPDPAKTKTENARITPVPGLKRDSIVHGVTALFSPQAQLDMLDLYADVCGSAKLLMVSAPFALHPKILTALTSAAGADVLRYVLADKEGSVGKKGEIQIMNREPAFSAAVATVLKSKLNDFQGDLLEGRESFHHAGVHIHSKVIAADPLGPDPILITGSANFSNNSTRVNDSNVLVFRGDTAVADIYVTEFMRMFEHYLFRYKLADREAGKPAAAAGAQPEVKTPSEAAVKDPSVVGMALKATSAWSDASYQAGSREMRDRLAFVGSA